MNLPVDFVSRLHLLLGGEEANKLITALSEPSPVSIRLNPFKTGDVQLNLNPGTDRVAWCSSGYYLPDRLTFTFDPLFHAGLYYVQEASSMFLEQAVKQAVNQPVLALDLCAAPGGKSTHLRSLLPEGSFLVANEVIRNRSQILAENITKWGHPDVMVTNNDPADFGKTKVLFDLIVADVPCSGEGMFRKDEGAIAEWSPANVEICHQRQKRIIADVWDSLKPGGVLIYSTCTYNTFENEENVQWICSELGAETVAIDSATGFDLVGDLTGQRLNVYRFLPHRIKGEGFFMAVLRKDAGNGDVESYARVSRNKKQKVADTKDQFLASPYYSYEQDLLKQRLRVVQCGISLGVQKGKDLVPSHAVAMVNTPEKKVYPTVEVDYQQAIRYLRHEAIVLDANAPKGYVLITYKNVPLGFAKNLGNRANNLYPQEWRIRSGYLPEDIRTL